MPNVCKQEISDEMNRDLMDFWSEFIQHSGGFSIPRYPKWDFDETTWDQWPCVCICVSRNSKRERRCSLGHFTQVETCTKMNVFSSCWDRLTDDLRLCNDSSLCPLNDLVSYHVRVLFTLCSHYILHDSMWFYMIQCDLIKCDCHPTITISTQHAQQVFISIQGWILQENIGGVVTTLNTRPEGPRAGKPCSLPGVKGVKNRVFNPFSKHSLDIKQWNYTE